MREKLDLVNQRFGKLTVLEFIGIYKESRYIWLCRCDCGKITKVYRSDLRNGNTKSCGCIRYKHGESDTRLHNIWRGMKGRCTNPKAQNYKYYGGKGIKVCPKWEKYITFRNWANANGYKKELVIDRINSNGNYEPTNCRWVTKSQNYPLYR